MKSAPGVLVAVRLTSVGRPQHAVVADPTAASSLVPGNQVVVETEAGAALGTVAAASAEVARRQGPGQCPLRVIRIATADDVAARRRQREREAEAYRVGLMKVRERGLAMKLTRVEHLFDGSRLIFYFTAEGRVDFRELVRELASEFHTRIEMRQVGVRDEAKMLGGYGSTLLHDMAAVVRTHLDQDGQAAGAEPQPIEALRPVRSPEMLPSVRVGQWWRPEGTESRCARGGR
jgi:cell fate regulator YaaT (PSP1 superfamily)